MNRKSKDIHQIIHFPVNSLLGQFSFLSVTRSGSMKGVGYNSYGRITSSLSKTNISQFTEFSMNNGSSRPLAPVLAFCTLCGTLCMFTKSCERGIQLVYVDKDINRGTPVFLDIGNHERVSFFGRYSHSASICANG